jgi:hypothetical protein
MGSGSGFGTGGCGKTRLLGLTTGARTVEGLARTGWGGLVGVRVSSARNNPLADRGSIGPTRNELADKAAAGIPSASTLKSAVPAASASPPGTTTGWSHRGHLSVRPARSSGTISVCPFGHLIRRGMASV